MKGQGSACLLLTQYLFTHLQQNQALEQFLIQIPLHFHHQNLQLVKYQVLNLPHRLLQNLQVARSLVLNLPLHHYQNQQGVRHLVVYLQLVGETEVMTHLKTHHSDLEFRHRQKKLVYLKTWVHLLLRFLHQPSWEVDVHQDQNLHPHYQLHHLDPILNFTTILLMYHFCHHHCYYRCHQSFNRQMGRFSHLLDQLHLQLHSHLHFRNLHQYYFHQDDPFHRLHFLVPQSDNLYKQSHVVANHIP